MGILDKVMGEIRRMSHTEDEDDYESDGLESIEPPRGYERKERSERYERKDRSERNERRNSRENADWEKERIRNRVMESESKNRSKNRETRGNSSILELHTNTLHQVMVIRPKEYLEVTAIADSLRNKITILLNMEETEDDVSTRIADFIAGVAYATDGKFSILSNDFILVTPFTVNLVEEELLDGLENQGVFYKT